MLKRTLLSVAAVAMLFGSVSISGTANASDDLLKQLASMDTSEITTTEDSNDLGMDLALEDEDDFGQNDVDALLGDDDNDEDAVAACFRRIGYGYGRSFGRSYSRGYSSYGYSSYRYYPSYNYRCYRPVTYTYHHPVTYHVPVYTSYWSCY